MLQPAALQLRKADKTSCTARSSANLPDRRRVEQWQERQLILNTKAGGVCVKEKLKTIQLVPAL